MPPRAIPLTTNTFDRRQTVIAQDKHEIEGGSWNVDAAVGGPRNLARGDDDAIYKSLCDRFPSLEPKAIEHLLRNERKALHALEDDNLVYELVSMKLVAQEEQERGGKKAESYKASNKFVTDQKCCAHIKIVMSVEIIILNQVCLQPH